MSDATTCTPHRINGPDGVIDVELCVPDGAGSRPAVLYLIDIGGIRPSQVERAGRLASAGFVVAVPNLCYRTRRPPLFDFPRNMKEERSIQRMRELVGPLTPEALAGDARVYVNWLRARPEVVPGPIAVIGHCFSGAIALRFAAAQPDEIALAMSFHGGGLAADAPTSPHLLLPQVKARLYFGHAVEDQGMPADAIARLDRALDAWGGRYESEIYSGARHGWTASDSAAYNAEQDQRAFQTIVATLRATLK